MALTWSACARCCNMAIFYTHQWWTVELWVGLICAIIRIDHLLIGFRAVLRTHRTRMKKKTKQKRNKTRSRSKKTTTKHRKKRALCFHVFSLIKTLFLCFLSCMLPRLTIILTDRIDFSKEREIKKVLLNRLNKPGSRWFFFAFHSIFCFLFSKSIKSFK